MDKVTTNLTMHEDLPFDEEAVPPLISTGQLPAPDEVRDTRRRGLRALPPGRTTATVADYIPALA